MSLHMQLTPVLLVQSHNTTMQPTEHTQDPFLGPVLAPVLTHILSESHIHFSLFCKFFFLTVIAYSDCFEHPF